MTLRVHGETATPTNDAIRLWWEGAIGQSPSVGALGPTGSLKPADPAKFPVVPSIAAEERR